MYLADAEVKARLTQLVHDRLGGATLRQFHKVDEYANENCYVVVWERPFEWGTHRACLSHNAEMLEWGHFFRPNMNASFVADVYKDYHARIARGY